MYTALRRNVTLPCSTTGFAHLQERVQNKVYKTSVYISEIALLLGPANSEKMDESNASDNKANNNWLSF